MTFFANVVVSLGINHESNVSHDDNSNFNLGELIYQYNNHLSILSIQEKVLGSNSTIKLTLTNFSW